MKGNKWNYDHHAATEDARRPQTGDGSSDNKGSGAWGSVAESRPGLEDHHQKKEDPFCRVQLVDAAGNGVKTGSSQHVGTTIPANIIDGIELVGDFWNGRRNNGSILLRRKPGAVELCSELTNATRKIDVYMPMIIAKNFRVSGWKFFSASAYSSNSSSGRPSSAAGALSASGREAVDDIVIPGRTDEI